MSVGTDQMSDYYQYPIQANKQLQQVMNWVILCESKMPEKCDTICLPL